MRTTSNHGETPAAIPKVWVRVRLELRAAYIDMEDVERRLGHNDLLGAHTSLERVRRRLSMVNGRMAEQLTGRPTLVRAREDHEVSLPADDIRPSDSDQPQ